MNVNVIGAIVNWIRGLSAWGWSDRAYLKSNRVMYPRIQSELKNVLCQRILKQMVILLQENIKGPCGTWILRLPTDK